MEQKYWQPKRTEKTGSGGTAYNKGVLKVEKSWNERHGHQGDEGPRALSEELYE